MSVDEYLDSISVATLDSDAPQQAAQEWGSSEPSKVGGPWVFILVAVTSAHPTTDPPLSVQNILCFPIRG